jgi:hypothetical protein
VTPHFTHGTNLTIHQPEAPGTKLSVVHGFYLRNEEKNMLRNTEILTVYSKSLDPEEFDSFFTPGQYEVGKDFFIRLEFNQKVYTEKNEASGILKIHEVEKMSHGVIRLWVTLTCQLRTNYSDPVEETTLHNGTLIIEFKRYSGE